MNKEIEYLDKVINFRKKTDLYENRFFWIYPFTNENILGYYSNIDFSNKSVLSVTSSGDHIINAFLMGAKSVYAFDLNPLAKHYVELKIAAIKTLSLEEFILFFYNKSGILKKHFLNKGTYLKIRNSLDDKTKYFWDYLFQKYSKKDIVKSYLFTDDFLNIRALLKVNPYLNLTNYYKVREILNNKTVTYYDGNLSEIYLLKKKFDILILSNIPAFLNDIYDKNSLKRLKNLIEKISKENSRVVVNYYYNNLLSNYDYNIIYDNKKVRNYFTKDDYKYIFFESSHNMNLVKPLRVLSYREDKVLISKDKKNY